MNYAIMIMLVSLDQLTKYVVSSRMYVGQSSEVLSFVHITYLTNTGIAFSMFQNANAVFIGFTLLALIGMAVWHLRATTPHPRFLSAALLLVFSGACGNLIDRLFRGAVVDFLDVSIGSYHWPAFNVADSCISVGAVIIILSLLRKDPHVSQSR